MNEEAKNPPTVEEAQAHLAAALANEEAAVLANEKAGEDMEAATSACVSATPGKLDACISAKIRAREKQSIAAERLSVARQRSGAAAVALRAAELTELEVEAENARIALAEADDSILRTVPALVEQLLARWTEARTVHMKAGAAASAVAKTKGVPAVEVHGTIAEHTKTIGRAVVDPVASTASLMAWLNAAPQRAAERARAVEMRAAARATADLAGRNGPEAQEAARIAAREFLVANGAVCTSVEVARTPRYSPPVGAAETLDNSDAFSATLIEARRPILTVA